jgi:hypothetical protein
LQRRRDRSNRRHPAQTNGFSGTPPFDKLHALACFVFCAESRSGTRAVKHILGEYCIGRQSPGTISDMLLGRSAVKAPPGFLNIIISGNAGLRAAV